MRKRLCGSLLFFIVLASVSFAQVRQKTSDEAQKFDEFGMLPEGEWKARLDALKPLLESPDLTPFIIVYAQTGTARTSADHLGKELSRYLAETKGLGGAESRWFPGGFRKSQSAEVRLVTKGGESPTATPDEPFRAEIIAEVESVSDEELNKLTENFYARLLEEPSAQGYVINYGSAEEMSRRENVLGNSRRACRYDAARITTMRGGNEAGKERTVFWIVPAGAEPPPR